MDMSCTWDINRGFGERSWRYSALINNGTVEALFEENKDLKPDPTNSSVTNNDPDPFEVSDAGTMLDFLKSA